MPCNPFFKRKERFKSTSFFNFSFLFSSLIIFFTEIVPNAICGLNLEHEFSAVMGLEIFLNIHDVYNLKSLKTLKLNSHLAEYYLAF